MDALKVRSREAPWSTTALPPFEMAGVFGEWVAKRAVLLVSGGLGCLIAFAALFLFLFRFDVTVRASGVLEPASIRNVYSPASGVIRTVLIRPGDSVAEGDVLAILDGSVLTSRLEALRAEWRLQSRNRHLTHGAPALLEQEIAETESLLKRLEITSASSGTVLTQDVDNMPGMRIREGDLVFEVGIGNGWDVDALVADVDMHRVRVGDAAAVGVPAVPAREAQGEEGLPGHVVFIGAEPHKSGSDTAITHHVRVRLDSAHIEPGRLQALRRGAAATLRITTQPTRAIDLLTDYVQGHARRR
jgi:multidrug resistance efflux pump